MSSSDLGTLKILSPKTVHVVVGCFYRLSGGFGINFLSPRRSAIVLSARLRQVTAVRTLKMRQRWHSPENFSAIRIGKIFRKWRARQDSNLRPPA